MAATEVKVELPEEYTLEESNQKITKKLERLNNKGLQKITDFIGLQLIDSMFYLYLFKKYKTPCFLIEPTNDFWDILGLNLNIREVYSAEEQGQISCYLVNLAKKLVECIINDVNIIIIPLTLLFYSDGKRTAHANVLIYRKKFNHIEHFEPHGKTGLFNNNELNKSIELFIKMFTINVNYELRKKSPVKDFKFIELIGSNQVCPYLYGFQAHEESSTMFKILELEGEGYCTAWSMFFTELCLKNPSMTSSQIITSVFSTAQLKKSILDYFRNVIRGYATFINEKISTYFKFLLDDSIIDLNKIKKMNDTKRGELTSKMIMILNVEMRLAFNPNALDDRLAFLQDRAEQLDENNVEYKYIQLEISVLNKYKNHIGDFNSPIDTPPTPPPLLYVKLNKKTQKKQIICPPGKVLNPKTNRCVNVKPEKTVRQEIKERKEALDQEIQKITKECPPGKVLNPDTGRCIKPKVDKPIKTVKTVTKKEKMKKNEKKESNSPKIIVCPPGKEINPKTGRCVNIKIGTRKIKKEP
jgi:hypothetical protein